MLNDSATEPFEVTQPGHVFPLKARRGARLAAITNGGAIPDTADYDGREGYRYLLMPVRTSIPPPTFTRDPAPLIGLLRAKGHRIASGDGAHGPNRARYVAGFESHDRCALIRALLRHLSSGLQEDDVDLLAREHLARVDPFFRVEGLLDAGHELHVRHRNTEAVEIRSAGLTQQPTAELLCCSPRGSESPRRSATAGTAHRSGSVISPVTCR